ncbi:unnamed protein product [Ilex paraguariensis]|uniref:Uncharacterized protein n=1 Tax=Ilex paraguariensis TaxID=185542 RepID=A0ABC8S5I5_9AQUA
MVVVGAGEFWNGADIGGGFSVILGGKFSMVEVGFGIVEFRRCGWWVFGGVAGEFWNGEDIGGGFSVILGGEFSMVEVRFGTVEFSAVWVVVFLQW